jgi:hypothetical protein
MATSIWNDEDVTNILLYKRRMDTFTSTKLANSEKSQPRGHVKQKK